MKNEVIERGDMMKQEGFEKNMPSHWAEIRCDYMGDDGFWRVDAWKSKNEAEEGKVIAMIDDYTSRVLYIDPLARVDDYAKKVIKDKVSQIIAPLKIDKKDDHISVSLDAGDSIISAEFEPRALGNEYDRFYIGHQPDKEDVDTYNDIVRVEAGGGGIDIEVYDAFGDGSVYAGHISETEIGEMVKLRKG